MRTLIEGSSGRGHTIVDHSGGSKVSIGTRVLSVVLLICPDHLAGSSRALVRGIVWHCSSRQYTIEAILQVYWSRRGSSSILG